MWIFTFLFFFFGGLGLIVYREKVQRFTGNFGFAEHYFGPGGTFQFLLFLGLGLMIFSILYATGTISDIFGSTLGQFFTPSPIQK